MAETCILYGVGATKAGTSWLYSYLHDHEECHLRAVKELHYWDSFDTAERDKQVAQLQTRRAQLEHLRETARATSQGWQVRTTTRQISAIDELVGVMRADREDDLAYAGFLMNGATQVPRLVADLTPAYGTLSRKMMRRMIDFSPLTRVIYLMRDPLARLWSHVRMHAERNNPHGKPLEEKANNVLWRIIRKGHESHITDRGNYRKTLKFLSEIVPAPRLMLAFTESLFTQDGLDRICAFLGISPRPGDFSRKVLAGEEAQIRSDLVRPAMAMLRPQYKYVAAHCGPLPEAWQASLARAA